jgi:AmiR/NasT family two-component response regulator
VVALIETENPEFIVRAVSAGISAYACPIRQDQVMGAVDVALT